LTLEFKKAEPYQDGPHVQHDHSVEAPSSETCLSKQLYTLNDHIKQAN